MLNFLVLKNEKGDQSKGQYTRSREGELVGDIPGWLMLFDPKFINDQHEVKNRVERNTFVKALTPYDVMQTGNAALLSTSEAIKGKFQANLNINPQEWTVFFICNPRSISGSIPHGVFRTIDRDINNTEQRGMNISLLTTGEILRIYRSGSTNPGGSANAILSANVPPEVVNKLAAYMVTFSVGMGYRVYCNGDLIAQSSNIELMNYGFEAGKWELFPDFAGDIGMSGLLSVDLSKPENTKKRSNVFKMIAERYT